MSILDWEFIFKDGSLNPSKIKSNSEFCSHKNVTKVYNLDSYMNYGKLKDIILRGIQV